VKTRDFLWSLVRHTQRCLKNLRQSCTPKLELIACDSQCAVLTASGIRGQLRSNSLATAAGWPADAAGYFDQSQKTFLL
jgi:hypothetical protein